MKWLSSEEDTSPSPLPREGKGSHSNSITRCSSASVL